MDRENVVLAALSVSNDSFLSPVQLQKLFFLLDKNIPHLIGGPHFDFKPYNYGPFDPDLYHVMNKLVDEGLVDKRKSLKWPEYRLTTSGHERGRVVFEGLDDKAKNYIGKAIGFIQGLTFSQLVTAIYKAYPEMRKNSVFQR